MVKPGDFILVCNTHGGLLGSGSVSCHRAFWVPLYQDYGDWSKSCIWNFGQVGLHENLDTAEYRVLDEYTDRLVHEADL